MSIFNLSSFDYEGFLSQTRQLVEDVDQDEFGDLKRQALLATRRYSGISKELIRDTSPLCIHGGFILSRSQIEKEVETAKPWRIGECFWQILDTYLSDPLSLFQGWTSSAVARALGWSQAELDMVFVGSANLKLLKPDCEDETLRPVLLDSPYWHWLTFDGAYTGWLDVHQVSRSLALLKRDRDAMLRFDFQKLKGIDYDNPVVVEEYHLHSAHLVRDISPISSG